MLNPLRSWLALAYLIVFGSIIAFTAYNWLLEHYSPTLVATHTYVNPIVAVLLGWWLAGVAGVLVFALSVAALVGAGVPGWLGVLLVWAASWAIFIPVALFWRNGTSEYLRFNGRRMLFGFVFWIWFGFVAKVLT